MLVILSLAGSVSRETTAGAGAGTWTRGTGYPAAVPVTTMAGVTTAVAAPLLTDAGVGHPGGLCRLVTSPGNAAH